MRKHTSNCGNSIRFKRIVWYDEIFDEYYFRLKSPSAVLAAFCPFCGEKLPESKRDRWFEELEKLGIEPDLFDWKKDKRIPEKFKSSAWWTEDT